MSGMYITIVLGFRNSFLACIGIQVYVFLVTRFPENNISFDYS